MRHVQRVTAYLVAVLMAGLTACTDASSPTVGLAFTTRPAPGPVGGAQNVRVVQDNHETIVTVGNDVLTIQSVEIVLREIELERVDGPDCPDDPGVSDDGCEEISAGAQVVTLPLGSSADKLVTVAVPEGTFDEVEFAIHVPDPADGIPGFDGVSIRVTGMFARNGGTAVPFTFTSDLSEQQEVELSPPFVVPATGGLNFTIRVDISTWFLTADGSALVDPETADAGGANEALVEDNIRNSIEAFHDDDSDGLDDDTEDDDGGTEPDDVR